MDINVKITLSDKLFALLEDKLPNLGRRVERAMTKELGAQTRRESSISVTVSAEEPSPEPPTESDKPAQTREESNISVTVSAEETTPEPPTESDKPAPSPEAAAVAVADKQPSAPTVEDCRAALHRARVRFEGEDYNNTAGEGHIKYHKALTAIVKQAVLSASGGRADKIPALPEECRAAFIAAIDELVLDEKGFITAPPAPF